MGGDANCQNTDFPLYLGLEFGLKSLPGFIFCITGACRWQEIRHMAKNKTRYTKMFKTKLVLNVLMCVMCFLYMIVIFSTPKHVNISSWIN